MFTTHKEFIIQMHNVLQIDKLTRKFLTDISCVKLV